MFLYAPTHKEGRKPRLHADVAQKTILIISDRISAVKTEADSCRNIRNTHNKHVVQKFECDIIIKACEQISFIRQNGRVQVLHGAIRKQIFILKGKTVITGFLSQLSEVFNKLVLFN